MNVSRIALCTVIGMFLVWSFGAVASEGDCVVHPAAQRASWIAGHTALEVAVRLHHINAVKLLLSHGSNPNRMVGGNGTILDIVARSSDPADQAISKELRAYGAVAALTAAQ
jgi:hypothetical protein